MKRKNKIACFVSIATVCIAVISLFIENKEKIKQTGENNVNVNGDVSGDIIIGDNNKNSHQNPSSIIEFDKHDIDDIDDTKYYAFSDDNLRKIVFNIKNASHNHELAEEFFQQRKYSKSLDCYQLALNAQLESLGESHLDTAKTRNNKGIVLMELGRYDEAINDLNSSLVTFKNVYGDESGEAADIYYNISVVYSKMGDYVQAFSNLNKAQQFTDQNNLTNIITIYCTKASFYNAISENLTAEKCLQKAMDLANKPIFADENKDNEMRLLSNINNIEGDIKSLKGDYDKALDCYMEYYDLIVSCYGADSPHIITACVNISLSYIQKGDFSRGLYYKELIICKKR